MKSVNIVVVNSVVVMQTTCWSFTVTAWQFCWVTKPTT